MHSTCIASGYPGFVAVNRRELDAHAPLSWPLFDADGTPLLAAGERLPSEADLDWLFTMFAPHRPLPEAATTGEAAGRTEAANSAGSGASSGTGTSTVYLHGLPVPLPIGAWLQVRVAPDAQTARVRARLIGRAPNGMLIITPPSAGETRLPVLAGDRLALWTFPGDNLYEFTCDVHSVHQGPFDYVVLSRPSQVRETPVRRTPRVDTRLVARLSPIDETSRASFRRLLADPQDTPEWLVLVRDISADGAGIVAKAPLPEGCTHVALQFRVPIGADIVPILGMAVVRGVEGPRTDGTWTYGLEFVQMDTRNKAAIRCFVYESRLTDPRASH
ncbi:flagellar brake protein [Pandoraea faecigallinarum]|uniref:flagellar brake protein n=1 Tax=Pandoraea faecigallinarum TaxID=656179 RepID=UPI0009FD931F|nr:flagellar brake protein [Pandoraea faecigallinarum]